MSAWQADDAAPQRRGVGESIQARLNVPSFDAIAICGPTAAGKSEAAILVAEAIGGEIVNADSRQIYRDMPIGTGLPPPDAMARVPHHLFAFVDPCERFSAGAYVEEALRAIDAIAARGRVPVIVGGTGFYVDALRGAMPLDRPFADDAVRARVRLEAAIHPHETLREWLEAIAPNAAAEVPANDRYRTRRFLETALTARSKQAGPAASTPQRLPRVRIAVMDVDPDELALRIAARVRAMYDAGLALEAHAVWLRCPDAPALTGLGYAESLGWYRGEATRDEAIRASIERTRRYAKRQRTWFRRMRDAKLVSGTDMRTAADAIAALAREN
jgi:tRNA dimethylallyltransferase